MSSNVVRAVLLTSVFGAAGCVSRPPTIAHVHLGHALTGVHVTPNKQGYLLVAEKQFRKIQGYKQIPILIRELEALTPNKIEVVKRRKAS